MKKQNIPWDEIAALLKEKADLKQKRAVEKWLKESDENQMVLDEIINSWQLTKGKVNFYQPEKELLWKRLLDRIDYQGRKLVFNQLRRWWPAAAAILIIVFISGIWFGESALSDRLSPQVFSTIQAPSGSKTQIVLPDETKVWLNSGAQLRYPQTFSSQSRDVFVSGECFFDVTKNQHSPFIVHASNIDVKVFGTKFNVKENASSKSSEVILVSGKVQVLNKNSESLAYLKPSQQLIFKDNSCVVNDVDNITTLISWINNMLVFEDLPFEEVTRYLESWYGVKIRLDSSIYANHRYTFKVKTESLREVLELISVITPIEYTIEGEQVSIKYKDE